ncbi:MAG: 16S rRNA (guanine(527)-N(7))-methyltransferase RsmG [bacterium]
MEFTGAQNRVLRRYVEELEKWGNYFNLHSFDRKDLWQEAVITSALFLDEILPDVPKNRSDFKICDVGTGAGIPGVAIKVLLPGVSVTLVESNKKKVSFLKNVEKKLGLKRLRIISGDVAEFARKAEELYNVVVARAFGKKFLKYAFRLAARNGKILYYKKSYKAGSFFKEPDEIKKYPQGLILKWMPPPRRPDEE